MHHAIDVLFKLLNDKAVAVGERVAQQRRMPGAKAYDFFVESSFVEVRTWGGKVRRFINQVRR